MMVEHAKKSLRARLRDDLIRIDAQVMHERSIQAAHQLCESSAFEQADALMIFLPLKYEVDATPIAIKAWQMGKIVTVPLVNYEQRHMIPVEINSLHEPMDMDHYGVRTPSNSSPVLVSMIDLVVVPGLAFDQTGHRLGRGGGFYDQFLSQSAFDGICCGFTLDEQIVETVPVHDHDHPMDMLVTDKRTLIFNRTH